jgi:hypothetical protein
MPSDHKLYSLCQENAALKIIHPEHYELQALEIMTLNPKPYKHQPLLGWGAETNFIQTRNRPARQFCAKKFQNSFVEWLLACGTWHVGQMPDSKEVERKQTHMREVHRIQTPLSYWPHHLLWCQHCHFLWWRHYMNVRKVRLNLGTRSTSFSLGRSL